MIHICKIYLIVVHTLAHPKDEVKYLQKQLFPHLANHESKGKHATIITGLTRQVYNGLQVVKFISAVRKYIFGQKWFLNKKKSKSA